MANLLDTCPDVDRQHLRQLVRNAIRERDQEKPPKAARALFRYLRELRNGQP
jgi:ribosome-associated protein